MLKDGFIFNYNNLYIAYDHSINKVVGVICAIDKTVNLNYDYENLQTVNDRYNITVKNCTYKYKCKTFSWQFKIQ